MVRVPCRRLPRDLTLGPDAGVADAPTMKLQPLEYPPTVANLVRHAAHAFPASEFIVMPDRRLTFVEAEAQSRRLARRLLRNGLAKGTTVGVLFPQSPDFVVALLAVTRSARSRFRSARSSAVPSCGGPSATPTSTRWWRRRRCSGATSRPSSRRFGRSYAARPNAQLFLPDAPFLRRVWLAGATDPRPWVTAVPVVCRPGRGLRGERRDVGRRGVGGRTVGPHGDRADVGYDRGAQGDHPYARRAGTAGVEARAALRPDARRADLQHDAVLLDGRPHRAAACTPSRGRRDHHRRAHRRQGDARPDRDGATNAAARLDRARAAAGRSVVRRS